MALTVGSFALENLIKTKQKGWGANAIKKMGPGLAGKWKGCQGWPPKAKSESIQTVAVNYK